LPILKKSHKAAIKALDWSKTKNHILASGAGTADKRLRVWNIKNNEILMEKETSTQICNLLIDKQSDNVITGHGYPDNEICIWSSNQ
jgi:cell division cycle 20-like protein 1 (cofactor of APC complex)